MDRADAPSVLSAEEVAMVRRTLFLAGVPRHDLDDATQEVQLRVVKHAPRAQARAGWLSVVATRLAVDMHRRATTRSALLVRLRSMPQPAAADPADGDAIQVQAALALLDPELREVVVLRYFSDLSTERTAELLGVPIGTVKSRLHRAAGCLRDALPDGRGTEA